MHVCIRARGRIHTLHQQHSVRHAVHHVLDTPLLLEQTPHAQRGTNFSAAMAHTSYTTVVTTMYGTVLVTMKETIQASTWFVVIRRH